MTIAGRHIPVAWLQWTGILAAPAGWIITFMVGLWFTFAQCTSATKVMLPVEAWTIVATAVGACLAVLGFTAALTTWRIATHEDGDAAEAPPPRSRIHFMAVVGLTISPLLLAIILMSGIGAVIHSCQQA